MTLLAGEATSGAPLAAPDTAAPSPGAVPNLRKRPTSSRSRSTTIALIVVLGLALWFIVHSFVLTGLQERSTQARLYDHFRSELANETAPLGGAMTSGTPVAMLSVPSAGIKNAIVVEGTTSADLTKGPGHLRDTPLPGQYGASVLYGRSVTYGAPFRHISRLRAGDKLTVTTGEGVFVYKVDGIRKPGSRGPQPTEQDSSGLTLVTSEGAGWLNGWTAQNVVYVDSSLVKGKAQPETPGTPGTVSPSSRPMQGEPGEWVAIIFWLEAAVVVGGLSVWGWRRWPHSKVWIIGLPTMLAALWGLTGAIQLLLPNLY